MAATWLDQVRGGEVAVGEQQHALVEAAQKLWCIVGFAHAQGAEDGVEYGAGAACDHGQHPQHRIPRRAVAAAGPAERGQVRRGVGGEHRRAVDRAYQQATPSRRTGGGAADQVEQLPQRFDTDAATGLRQRRGHRIGDVDPVQARGHPSPHLAVAELGEQRRRQQQVHHHPRRQRPDPGLHRPGRFQHRIDHLERDDLGQLAEVTGREPTRSNHHRATNDRLNRQRNSQVKGRLARTPIDTGSSAALTHRHAAHVTLDPTVTPLTERHWG